jgi:uncharacterized protein DUF397
MEDDLTDAVWKKSTRSGANGQCVEVAKNLPGIVAVRHSKRPEAEVIVYTTAEWNAFIDGAKAGEFDL